MKFLETRLRVHKSRRQLTGRELYEFCKYYLYLSQTTYICSSQIVDNIQQIFYKYSTKYLSSCVKSMFDWRRNFADPRKFGDLKFKQKWEFSNVTVTIQYFLQGFATFRQNLFFALRMAKKYQMLKSRKSENSKHEESIMLTLLQL